MKIMSLFSLLCFLAMPSLGRAEATQTQATLNFVNSLIYEAMTDAPVWSEKVDYTSRGSHRDSFVRKQGSVTCTAMKYVAAQYSGLQSRYQCDLGPVSMTWGDLTFTGEAAELAYNGLAEVYRDHDFGAEEPRPNETLTPPHMGTLKTTVRSVTCNGKCVPSSITVLQIDASGFHTEVLRCSRPGEHSLSYGGGEFLKAEKEGALRPTRLNSYACQVILR